MGFPRNAHNAGQSPGLRAALRSPLFLLFLLYVIYSYLQFGVRFPALGQLRGQLLIAIVLLVACAMALPRLNLPRLSAYWWALLLLLFCAARAILTVDPKVSWEVLSGPLFQDVAMALFIVCFVRSVDHLKLFIAIVLLCFFKMGLEGLIGSLDGSMMWQNQEIPRLHGSTPLYRHPNSFSGTQLSMLPYVIAVFPLVGPSIRAVLVFQALLILNVVVRTGSRTGYVATLGLAMSYLMMSRSRVRVLIICVLSAVAAIQFVPAEYLGRFQTIFEDDPSPESSTYLRRQILADAVEVVARYPLGVGLGAFPTIRQAMFGRIQDTHNLYLEVATNIGLPGLLVFVGFIGATMAALWRVRGRADRLAGALSALHAQRQSDQMFVIRRMIADCQWITAIAQATLLFLLTRLFLGAFGHDFYEVYWWFAFGLTVSLTSILGSIEDRARIEMNQAPRSATRRRPQGRAQFRSSRQS